MKGLIGNSLFAACCIATAVFTGCGNDSTSNANVTDNPTNTKSGTLPDTVASFNDLQMQYNCNSSLKCKGTFLLDMGYAVCDGNGSWTFGSLIHKMDCGIDYVPGYDDPISSSSAEEDAVNSSSSVTTQGDESRSSANNEVEDLSSSSTPEESSSSDGLKYEQKVVCSATATAGACDAMDKNDVSTWHFVGKDAFGDAVEYTYSVNADDDLVVSTKGVNGSNEKVVAHNMSKAVYAEMAFSAAKSTCESVGGNEAGADAEQTCDTLLVPVVEYGTLTDKRDNKEYKTVTIGKLVWMAENLKYEEYSRKIIDGEYFYEWVDAIDGPQVNDTLYCGTSEKCDISENIQGVCPDGWRLPSKADLESLVEIVGEEQENYLSATAGGKDLFGLSVVLTGYYNGYDGKLQYDGENINFWAADNSNWRADANATSLEITDSHVEIDEFPKGWGASVRCVKDAE